MTKKKRIVLVILLLISSIIIDRYFFMVQRVNGLYLWESGPDLGDPISYNHSFKIIGSKVIFEEYEQKETWPQTNLNRKSELYFAGCYFGNLYIFDQTNDKLIVYMKK